MVQVLKTDDFEKNVLGNSLPVVIDFYADWCGPCKMMAPILEKVSEEAASSAAIYKVNVDTEPLLAAKFNIMSVPTLIMFKDGEEKGRTVGLQTMDALLKQIEAL